MSILLDMSNEYVELICRDELGINSQILYRARFDSSATNFLETSYRKIYVFADGAIVGLWHYVDETPGHKESERYFYLLKEPDRLLDLHRKKF